MEEGIFWYVGERVVVIREEGYKDLYKWLDIRNGRYRKYIQTHLKTFQHSGIYHDSSVSRLQNFYFG